MDIELNVLGSILQPLELKDVNTPGLSFFVKRDDLIHPFISGNKWRKLKYVLKEARQRQAETLITFGGAYSNHLLAVACAGATFGFKTAGFVRGQELDIKNPVLKMCHLFGMRLIFITREQYRDKEQLMQKYFGNDPSAFFIPEGGSNALALPGVAELLDELPFEPDHIITAAGTGGTMAGLAYGVAKKGWKTEVHGIAVIKGASYLNAEIEKWAGVALHYHLHDTLHRDGYAKTDNELVVFCRTMARNTGMVIEPVYTAKMMMGTIALANEGRFAPGSKVVCLHTGGVWAGVGLLF